MLQYDFLGNFKAKYISAASAARALNKSRGSMIAKASNGTEIQAFKYIWIYEEDFSEELLLQKVQAVKACRFYKNVITEIKNKDE